MKIQKKYLFIFFGGVGGQVGGGMFKGGGAVTGWM